MSRRPEDGVAAGVLFEGSTRSDSGAGFWKASLLSPEDEAAVVAAQPGWTAFREGGISLPQRLQ